MFQKLFKFNVVNLLKKLPKWPNFRLKILFGAKFAQLFEKNIAQKLASKHSKKTTKCCFWSHLFFSCCQFSYLVFLVPEIVQSGSCQNKKLQTLAGTGSDTSGSGWAWAGCYGLWSGSGFPQFSSSQSGLGIFSLSYILRLPLGQL